jgi:hypothetical protein
MFMPSCPEHSMTSIGADGDRFLCVCPDAFPHEVTGNESQPFAAGSGDGRACDS